MLMHIFIFTVIRELLTGKHPINEEGKLIDASYSDIFDGCMVRDNYSN